MPTIDLHLCVGHVVSSNPVAYPACEIGHSGHFLHHQPTRVPFFNKLAVRWGMWRTAFHFRPQSGIFCAHIYPLLALLIADLQQGHSGWGWEVGEVPPSALFDQLATSVGVTGWLFNNIPVLDPPHFQLSHLGGGQSGWLFNLDPLFNQLATSGDLSGWLFQFRPQSGIFCTTFIPFYPLLARSRWGRRGAFVNMMG